MSYNSLFEQFVRHKVYLENISESTVRGYRKSFRMFCLYHPEGRITKASLVDFVTRMREAGTIPSTANTYIRSTNSFLRWLHENEHLKEPLKVKLLRQEKKIIKPFSEPQLRAIISFKPHGFGEHRMHTLLCLLIDIGVRINEALTLTRENVDFDNLFLKVKGKGTKERLVPFSLECRRLLFRFLKRHNYLLVFPARNGGKYNYQNARRDFRQIAEKLSIEGLRISFHTLRPTFGLNFIRYGGDVFSLKKCLGHERLTTTQIYVDLQPEDIKAAHAKTSIFSRLR